MGRVVGEEVGRGCQRGKELNRAGTVLSHKSDLKTQECRVLLWNYQICID